MASHCTEAWMDFQLPWLSDNRGDATESADLEPEVEEVEQREWSVVDADVAEPDADSLDATTQALLEITRNKQSVLLVGEPQTPAEERVLAALIGRERDQASSPILVTMTESPAKRVLHCEDYARGLVSEIRVLAVDSPAWRAATADDAPSSIEVDGKSVPVTTETVGDIGELRRLGIRLNQLLIEAEAIDRFVPMMIPLSDMLEVGVSHDRVFRFIAILRRRIMEYGGLLVVTVAPEDYENEPPERFEELFDVTFGFSSDGRLEQL
jgi:hypothetical protein